MDWISYHCRLELRLPDFKSLQCQLSHSSSNKSGSVDEDTSLNRWYLNIGKNCKWRRISNFAWKPWAWESLARRTSTRSTDCEFLACLCLRLMEAMQFASGRCLPSRPRVRMLCLFAHEDAKPGLSVCAHVIYWLVWSYDNTFETIICLFHSHWTKLYSQRLINIISIPTSKWVKITGLLVAIAYLI